MNQKDTLQIEVLPDGRIKTITSSFSPAAHQNAADFIRSMSQLAGGETTRVKRADRPVSANHAIGQVARS